MKRRFISLFSLGIAFCGILAADRAETSNDDELQRLAEQAAQLKILAASATRVEIEDKRPRSGREIASPLKTEETKKAAIKRFTDALNISEVPIRGAKVIANGQEIWSLPYCQCTPDYVVSYYRNDQLLIAFEINHWTHLRFRCGDSTWYDEDLVPESIDKLKEELARRFLPDALFFKKEANQSAQTRSLTRPV